MQGKGHSHRHDCEIGPSRDFQDPERAIEGHAGSHGYYADIGIMQRIFSLAARYVRREKIAEPRR
jgi:hypothetical protein